MAASPEPSVLHAEAIVARLKEATSYTVYLDEMGEDDPTYPYCVVWPVPGLRPADRLKGYGGEISTRIQITVAALSGIDLVGAADRTTGVLHRWRPQIEGRVCGYVEQDQDVVPGTPTPTPVPLIDPKYRALSGQKVVYTPLFFTLFSGPITNAS